MEARTLAIYEFTRRKVERGNFSHFLGMYGLDKLPTGCRLRQMMDSMVLVVDGWNNDPREVHMIPEVRQLYRQFRVAWPHWFYFCNLDQDGVKPMGFSCVDRITAIKDDDAPERVVTNPDDKFEFVGFLAQNLATMNIICERAKMFDTLVYDRSKAVFEYFGLPYGAERPE